MVRKGGGKKNGNKKKSGGRGMRRIKGRGDYQVSAGGGGGGGRDGIFAKLDRALARIPRGSFARAGGAMGNKYGGGLGAKVGALAGAGLSAISGYGDYKVKMNSLSRMSTSTDMIPQFVKNDHSVRVVHREFIRDMAVPAVPANFTNTTYTINPANKELFPWLANMSKQYSQYKIHGMVFAFKSMSSDYAASGPLGTVMMATNYNAVDRDFASKLELENAEFSVSCKPSSSLVHAIECDPKYSGLDVLYVRDPSYDTTDVSDKRFYDFGKFQVATQGLPGSVGATLGELWVSYDIELMKPIIGGSTVVGKTIVSKTDCTLGVSSTSDEQFYTVVAPGVSPAINTTDTLLFSNVGVAALGNLLMLGTVIDYSTSGIILRKNGRYTITLGGVSGTTSTSYAYPIQTAATIISLTPTGTGLASAAVITSTASTAQNAPLAPAGVPVTTSNGYGYRLTWLVYVTGVVTGADYVTLAPTTFTTAPAGIVTGLVKRLSVGWVALGTNDQSAAYTAVA